MRQLVKILGIGFVTGLLLNYYFKAIEWLTGDKVYTLLLNVDYLPVLKNYVFPEYIEIAMHLFVSLVLAGTYAFLWKRWEQPFLWTVVTSVLIGLLIYPSTGFSDRTPDITDGSALLWWQTGHLLYGVSLAWLLQRLNKK